MPFLTRPSPHSKSRRNQYWWCAPFALPQKQARRPSFFYFMILILKIYCEKNIGKNRSTSFFFDNFNKSYAFHIESEQRIYKLASLGVQLKQRYSQAFFQLFAISPASWKTSCLFVQLYQSCGRLLPKTPWQYSSALQRGDSYFLLHFSLLKWFDAYTRW